MIRVWFNHWFSTSYQLIKLMKQDSENQIYVIGSNRVFNSVIRNVCDEWYQEPSLDGEEYIDFCIQFCKQHGVQVFVPRRKMVDISQSRKRFEEIGVRVMVDDYDKIAFLNDKAATYDFFQNCAGIHVPDYRVVNCAEEFAGAYGQLREKYESICFKYVKDEGGMSFRRIVDEVDRFKDLSVYPGAKIAYDELITILKSQESFRDMMVMPYLPGNEISVDCLSTPGGLIAVAREKGPSRDERVFFDDTVLNMCRVILDKVPLEWPCNIQFKLYENIPYLLEINTRMSGGLQMSCLAADINIPNIALNKILGRTVPWTVKKEERVVSYIELPQLIDTIHP